MGLNSDDKHRLQLLSEQVFQPQSSNIIDKFYDFLLLQPEIKKFLSSDELVVRLKHTQSEYLAQFGVDFDSRDYFEYRLRIGIAHARMQLPLTLYLAAFSQIQILLQQAVITSRLNDNSVLIDECYVTISRIMMLDISLAIDSYVHPTMHSPSSSVEELKLQIDSLTNRLMHDSLTDVLSRAYILDIVHKQIAQKLDIDHFKIINDQFGHIVGDQVLQEFCKTVQSAIRQQDYFGRYGGEEFLLLINDADPDSALNLVERIRSMIDNTTYTINGHSIKFTISFGFSQIKPADTVEMLIQRVDSALYKAKATGRNKIIRA